MAIVNKLEKLLQEWEKRAANVDLGGYDAREAYEECARELGAVMPPTTAPKLGAMDVAADLLEEAGLTDQAALLRTERARLAILEAVEAREIATTLPQVMYGLDSGPELIPAGSSVVVSVTPQERHLLERLVMSEQMAANFELLAIEVGGGEPQDLTTRRAQNGQLWTARTHPELELDALPIVEAGDDVSITVRALTRARCTFTVYGRAVEL